MAGMTGQPGTKPSDIKNPNPSQAKADEVDALLAEFDAPETPASNDVDAMMNEVAGGAASVATPPGPEQFAQEPGFVQANIDQVNPENFITRLQAGLAANDTEKLGFLQKKYGPQNATVKDGALYYRKSAGDKFKRLDPEAFELIADIIPDFAREIVTEAALLPGEVGMGALGTAVAGPGGGTAAGAIAGRIASVPMANQLADNIAAMAGVPQDPARDIGQENLIGMGMETIVPVAGKYIKEFIPGTVAYKEAREAGEKTSVALSKQSREVVESLGALEREGLDIPMMAHQVHPDSPKLLTKAMQAQKNVPAGFAQRQMDVAEGYGVALENTLIEVARRGGHGPVAPDRLASVVTNAVETLDKAEGQAIGRYRAEAMANLKNAKQQLPAETSQQAVEIMKFLGFQPRSYKVQSVTRAGTPESFMQKGVQRPNTVERVAWAPPKNLQEIVGKYGLDESQARMVVNSLNEYGKIIGRGNEARLPDIERLINRMGPINRRLGGTELSGLWGKMTGDLRRFRREVIGNSLLDASGKPDPVKQRLYNAVMDDFKVIRENTEQLSGVLRADITAKTVISGFFRGKENLANIRAIKSITGKDSAEWGALKEEFVNQLLLKHADDGPTGYNSTALMNDLRKNYGDDFIREVLDDGKAGPNYDTVKNLLTVGKRIEAMTKGAGADTLDARREKAIADAGIGFFGGIKFKLVNGALGVIGGLGNKENALMEVFNRNGYEKYVAGYKGDKKKLAKNIEAALSIYNAGRAKYKNAVPAAEQVIKRGTKATVREEMSR